MVEPNDETMTEPDTLPITVDDDDEETVCTTTATTKIDFIEQEMVESTIRYEIPYRDGQANIKDFQRHIELMKVFSKRFDNTELRFIDNRNQRVKDLQEDKWLDQDYYQSRFNIHQDESQRKTVIAHRIRSKKSLASIKGDSNVIAFLKKTSTFLRAHFWTEDEVSLKDIGFLTRFIPSHHSKEFVIQEICERAEHSELIWSDAPPFKLIHAQPNMKIKGKPQSVKTHAYSIQVLSKDAAIMNQFLRTVFAAEPLYMPYKTKKKHPDVMVKAMLNQNKLIKETYVIVVVGVHRDLMSSISSSFEKIPGFIEVSDTNRTDKNGRWHVIVKAEKFHEARKLLSKELKQWTATESEIIKATTPDYYPIPQVNRKFGNDDDDESSSGQDSYMSSCAQSYASFDETDASNTQYYTPISTSTTKSYAEATRQKQSHTVHEVHVPKEKFEVETQSTRDLKMIIRGLEAKIATLELGQQTPSTVTAMSTPDTQTTARLDKFETSMIQFTEMMSEVKTFMAESTTQRALDKQNQAARESSHSKRASADPPLQHPPLPNNSAHYSSPSHQSKRADTRRTPERDDPMMTQPSDESCIQLFHNRDGNGYRVETTRPRSARRPRTTRGYDPNEPEYLYMDNGEGSLYAVGVAGPDDYDANGVRRGLHHEHSQPNTPYKGQPSPQRQQRDPVTGSSPSLPAEGARIYDA
jgi:hypothetical protein